MMKVVHLCLGSFYPDNYSYQENMLPKFHKELGYDVEVIASLQTFDEQGKTSYLDKPGSYYNEYNIKVTRLSYKSNNKIWHKLKRYKGTYEAIENARPDVLFIHGGQFLDIDKVIKYAKKNRKLKIYVDNHADFSNSATNFISKNILHKIIWRGCLKRIEPYTRCFYGVLPVRVDFLTNVYKLPKSKCQLLVMGADDELVSDAKKNNARATIRKKYGIASNDFLIVTGGKIDQWKKQTLLLMQAVREINNDKVKLVVFGSVTQELNGKLQELADGDVVKYIGWIHSSDSYNYFAAADLVIFPGRHSVMWEQAVGQGVPLVVKDWPGTHHVDLGGNVVFLKDDSVEELKNVINKLVSDRSTYEIMKNIAVEKGMSVFSYKDIAKRALE